MVAKLVVLNGKQAGVWATLQPDAENSIGRESHCVLVLEDPASSRVHATIAWSGEHWTIADRDSANGTFVNGHRVPRADLHDGDKLLIGSTWLRFVATEPAPPIGPTPPTWVLEDSVNPATSLTAIAARSSNARRNDLDCLERISSEIANQTDPQRLIERTLEVLVRHLNAGGARLLWKQGQIAFAEYIRSSTPPLSDEIVRQAMLTSEAVMVPVGDARQQTRTIFAPLKYLQNVEGVLWVADALGQANFNHEDLCLVASVAHLLAPPFKMLLEVQQLQRKNLSLSAAASLEVVGRSPAMQRVLQIVARVADVDQTVLLRGESGVGKEVIAKLIHETGARRDHAMVCVNCAALTETLLESELFGHEKGAFTGALQRRPGKFEIADGGTLFLDELGNMSLATQAKLLRVLDGHAFERVGGHARIQVDVRIIAATNADLEALMQSGRFREDLYHRLRVIEIRIPPLRERVEDIAPLAEHFLRRYNEHGGRQMAFEPQAMAVLKQHPWPGNVRQLRNTVERAAILAPERIITAESLEAITLGGAGQEILPIYDLNRVGIERALGGSANVPEAAQRLGMSRSALYRHMKKLGITPPRRRR